MPHAGRDRRIGLLGGSFNPAHEGHLFVSHVARRQLGLDEVWWLVAPHNPLKPVHGMLSFPERLQRARTFAKGTRISVTGLEADLGTHFTVDTVACLRRRAPLCQFAWLMGADNLAGIHLWKHWQRLFAMIPIAVFDRAPYSLTSLTGRAAIRYRRCRIQGHLARSLVLRRPPVWALIAGHRHDASATAIRSGDVRFAFADQTNRDMSKGRFIHSS